MTRLHHLVGRYLHAPPDPRVVRHRLLLDDPAWRAVVDAGIGLMGVRSPAERVGRRGLDPAGGDKPIAPLSAAKAAAVDLFGHPDPAELPVAGDPHSQGGRS